MTWNNLTVHWKTTTNGFLILVIVTCGVLAGQNVLSSKAASIVALISALARAYVGIISMDAGTVLAKVPGNPLPQPVPSTEVPLDPKAKVVKE